MGSSIAQFSGNILNGKKSLLIDKNKLVKNANLLLMKKKSCHDNGLCMCSQSADGSEPYKKGGSKWKFNKLLEFQDVRFYGVILN